MVQNTQNIMNFAIYAHFMRNIWISKKLTLYLMQIIWCLQLCCVQKNENNPLDQNVFIIMLTLYLCLQGKTIKKCAHGGRGCSFQQGDTILSSPPFSGGGELRIFGIKWKSSNHPPLPHSGHPCFSTSKILKHNIMSGLRKWELYNMYTEKINLQYNCI